MSKSQSSFYLRSVNGASSKGARHTYTLHHHTPSDMSTSALLLLSVARGTRIGPFEHYSHYALASYIQHESKFPVIQKPNVRPDEQPRFDTMTPAPDGPARLNQTAHPLSSSLYATQHSQI